jgi:Flp pilus assembly protein TadB
MTNPIETVEQDAQELAQIITQGQQLIAAGKLMLPALEAAGNELTAPTKAVFDAIEALFDKLKAIRA